MVKKIKMIIYDCDGVIFDSKKANLEYYNYIFKNFNLPAIDMNDKENILILHTYSNDNVFKHFIKDKILLKEVLEFSKTIDYSIFYKYMKIERNFLKTCNILKEKNLKIGVATNRSISFKGISEYFKFDEYLDDYVTALDVKNPKPAPDMLLLLLDRNNLNNDEVIFVGDSSIDYQAAKSANINFTGFNFHTDNSFVIYSHNEIFEILERCYHAI